MARVTYGALITELAGSIGGVTFHKNASGNIARLKPNMPMNASQQQTDQHNKLNSLIAIWPTLTLVQKTSWNNLAAAHPHINPFSVTKNLNGFQWFMSCNLNLLQVGEAVILTAPAYAPPAAPTAYVLFSEVTFLALHFSAPWNFTPNYLVLYVTPPIRQSSLKFKKATFFISSTHNYNAEYYNITALYIALFNLVWADVFNLADCTIIARAKIVQTGTGLSSPYTTSMIKFPV